MRRKLLLLCWIWLPHLAGGAEASREATNAPTVTLDAVVAEVLEENPELNFYKAEIAAAKGEKRSAAAWSNPELLRALLVESGALPGLPLGTVLTPTKGYPDFAPSRKVRRRISKGDDEI